MKTKHSPFHQTAKVRDPNDGKLKNTLEDDPAEQSDPKKEEKKESEENKP